MVTKISLGVVDPAVLDRANHTGEQPISATQGLAEALDAVDIETGKWTPTLTNVINVAASGTLQATYQRVGNIVTCWGAFTAQATAAAGASTAVRASLPIPSNFTTSLQGRGLVATTAAHRSGACNSDVANDAVAISWASESTANLTWTFHFSYEIV